MEKIKCDCCNRKKSAEGVFVYEGVNYCFECSSALIYQMAESGHFFIEHDDAENKGVRLRW